MSDTVVHIGRERSMKTEEHSGARDFQHFLDSAAIELDVFNDLIFDLSLLCCSYFIRHVALLVKVFSLAGLIVRSTRSRLSRSRPTVTQLVFMKCNRHSFSFKLTSSVIFS